MLTNNRMVRAGVMSRKLFPILKECEICGKKDGLLRHHLDYKKPKIIMVLCRSCHVKWHARNKALNRNQRIPKKIAILKS